MIYYTYTFKDVDGTPIYVGKGKGGRAFSHLTNSSNIRLKRVICKRKADGVILKPDLQFYETEKLAYEAEINLISLYGRFDLGAGTLFNLTDGGDGGSLGRPKGCKGFIPSVETLAKRSASLKGHPAWNKGISPSRKTRDLISAKLKGRPMSEDDKIKRRKPQKNPSGIPPWNKKVKV